MSRIIGGVSENLRQECTLSENSPGTEAGEVVGARNGYKGKIGVVAVQMGVGSKPQKSTGTPSRSQEGLLTPLQSGWTEYLTKITLQNPHQPEVVVFA